MNFESKNAENVLQVVENLIAKGDSQYKMDDVYSDLSIFDWWTDYLSQGRLRQMRSFLKTAINLGYKGYVCFKVGVTGCANGMWAHKEESTTGYSPDGECLYRSFTPAYVGWDAKLPDNTWVSNWVDSDCTNTPLAVVKFYLNKYNK